MSESRLTVGDDAVTPLTPRTHPVGYDPGFFALDRRVWGTLKDQYGSSLARWYLDLAAECTRKTPNRYQYGRVQMLAEILGESADTTRRVLTRLERAGLIRWTRATNQNNGEVVLLVDLERERVKTPRPTKVPLPATSEAQIVASPVVDNALGDALGDALGAVVLHRPMQGKRDIPRTNEPRTKNQTPPPPLRDDHADLVKPGGWDQCQSVIEQAAQIVATDRQTQYGTKAGTGAVRKIADQIAVEHSNVIAKWLTEGHPTGRIALAVAERHRTNHDRIMGNSHAVPWSPGNGPIPDTRNAEPCHRCDGDGWVYIEAQRASLRCECQNVAMVAR
jgi:DNA-binding MarR family transcriptional regulator